MPRYRAQLLISLLLLAASSVASGQDMQSGGSADAARRADSATAASKAKRRWSMPHANEVHTPYTTIRIGGGFLPEASGYENNANAQRQIALIRGGGSAAPIDSGSADPADVARYRLQSATEPPPVTLPAAGKLRDSRFIVSGRLATKRAMTWQTGLMYDWALNKWKIRQTVVTVAIPEIGSAVWVGRMKEGPSLNRMMVGYDGWTMERFTFSDAAIPLLADGIRWQGYLPKAHFIWNLGAFTNLLSEGEAFSYFTNQVAGRVGYVRMESDTAGSLLHLALGFHAGIPNEGMLQLKSKPEASGAPNFIDTGRFPATAAQLLGLEAYYRPGPWIFGTEYYVERAKSPQTNNPVFHGGDVSVSWTMTGETRRYVVPGSTFSDVSPARPVFHGGPGALEAVLRLSNIDLDAGTLTGGKFWRLTPMLNWYLSDNVRLEFAYGYGVLNRFGLRGITQFYQSRLQLQL